MTRRGWFVLLGAAVVACGGGSAYAASEASALDVLNTADISGTEANTAWDVIARLRPQWLRSRGGRLTGPAEVVYVDDRRQGRLTSLRDIPAASIQRLEWIDGMSATQRWGTGHGAGVIHVVSRPR
jgi:hypothetical protein